MIKAKDLKDHQVELAKHKAIVEKAEKRRGTKLLKKFKDLTNKEKDELLLLIALKLDLIDE